MKFDVTISMERTEAMTIRHFDGTLFVQFKMSRKGMRDLIADLTDILTRTEVTTAPQSTPEILLRMRQGGDHGV